MEKQTFNISFSRLSSSLRSMSSGSMNANTMWRLHISLMLASLCAVGVFAYLTYVWAINDDVVQIPSSGGRDTQTISELASTISLYREKEKTYESLRVTRPDAPAFARGYGIDLPESSLIPEEDILIETPVGPVGTSSPVPQIMN